MRTVLSTLTAALTTAASPAIAQTELEVQTSVQSGGYGYKYLQDNWAEKLPEMTDGTLSIDLLPINSVVPRDDTPDAVASGVLDGDLTSIEYFSGRNPAFALMGNLIAGYDDPSQLRNFCREGGGQEYLQTLWDKTMPGQIHVVGCAAVSKEALVSSVPIRGVSDLSGLKIRSPAGLASTVFRKAGATPVNIPITEVFTSLEKGVIEAADASAYTNNVNNGYHQIAPYPIYPGIHSMTVRQFTIDQDIWDDLDESQKQGLQEWFYAAYKDLANALKKRDLELVKQDKNNPDIEVIDWPQSERDKFREIAREAWQEMAAKSPEAETALETHLDYMRSIDLMN